MGTTLSHSYLKLPTARGALWRRVLAYASASLAALVLASCGGSGGAAPSPNAPTLSSLEITPATASVYHNGAQQFKVEATYSDNSTADVTSTAAWASSNDAVATVGTTTTDAGVASAVSEGSANITASLDGVTAQAATLQVNGWQETILHSFDAHDGNSWSTLVQGSDGTLYGTTGSGGANSDGSVFRLNPDGTGYQVLHSFDGTDGTEPSAGLAQDSSGWLYGTTYGGGAQNDGMVFKIKTDGTGFAVLHEFDGTDGVRQLESGVTLGSDGSLYGTARSGAVFKINTDGSGYGIVDSVATDLRGGIIQGQDGALYGAGYDEIYTVKTDGTGAAVLYTFNAATDGDGASSNMVEDSNGWLYGTASFSGPGNGGTLFKLEPDGTGYAVLHAFTAPGSGYPYASLILAKDGLLYGTTVGGGNGGNSGTVFRINPDGTGYETIYSFQGTDGMQPYAGLLQGSDGALYGVTSAGGTNGTGVVFKLQ